MIIRFLNVALRTGLIFKGIFVGELRFDLDDKNISQEEYIQREENHPI